MIFLRCSVAMARVWVRERREEFEKTTVRLETGSRTARAERPEQEAAADALVEREAEETEGREGEKRRGEEERTRARGAGARQRRAVAAPCRRGFILISRAGSGELEQREQRMRCGTRGKLLGWKGGGGVQRPRPRVTGGGAREGTATRESRYAGRADADAEGRREEKACHHACSWSRCPAMLGRGAPHRPPKPALGTSSPANFRSSSLRPSS